MAKRSAGLLLYRQTNGLEIFLVHPGGPFWSKKDDGAWSIPKGEYPDSEDPLAAARREFEEETGCAVDGEFVPLGEIRQAGGKLVAVWAIAGDIEAGQIRSNTFSLEWPPRSGKIQEFPEVDRAAWFTLADAEIKLLPAQLPFLTRLAQKLDVR